MSNFQYKNPISPIQLLGSQTVNRSNTFGVSFSVLNTGGFMEVYNLSDLNYLIPEGQTGTIQFTGNTIPIQFTKGSGSVFSPDVLTLNSDNISSGRRRLGMLVYVYETNHIYQYTINNYDSLWSAATISSGPGGNTVVISDFGTTIKNNSVAGQNLINSWTGSTIEGIDGYDSTNSTWTILKTNGGASVSAYTYNDNTFTIFDTTGGTYSATINSVTGLTINGTLSATTISGGTYYGDGSHLTGISTQDTRVTGFTYDNNTFTITNSTGGTLNASINSVTGLTVNGTLSATTISGGTYYGDGSHLSGVSTSDTTITGFTYNNRNTFFIRNSSGGTLSSYFNVMTGLTINGTLSATTISGDTFYGDGSHLTNTKDYYTTGVTLNNTTLVFNRNDIASAYTVDLSSITASTYSVGNGVSVISGVSNYNTALKSFSGTNISIIDTGDKLTFTANTGIHNLIVVGKSGNVNFTSISDAVNSINDSSVSNSYLIQVGPGEYIEPEIDLSNKPYVSIEGSSIETTEVITLTPTQHIFLLGVYNEISFLTLRNAGSGYAAIAALDSGVYSLVHKASFYDCDINVLVTSQTQITQFYGEYIDFNGTYSYGVKVLANNGFQALASLENYFNFPTGTGVTIGNYAQGSGATLNIYSSSNVDSNTSGSTAVMIGDSATLNMTSVSIENWDYGIRVLNIGNYCTFDVNGINMINTSSYNLSVENQFTKGSYQGTAVLNKIYNISPDVYWSFLDTETGQFSITRKISVTFQEGTSTDMSGLLFQGSTMGLIEGGGINILSGLTINVQPGYGYLESYPDVNVVRRFDWETLSLTLPPNTQSYIFINENGLLGISSTTPDTIYNILLGRVVTNLSTIAFVDESPLIANHTSNLISKFNRNALGPIYQTGSIVTVGSTPFQLNVSNGIYFYSEHEFLPSGGTNINFVQYSRNGLSGWTTSATTFVNHTSYDNNGTLTGLTASSFTKHTLYVVGDANNEKYFLVLGQNEYPTLVQAENAYLPLPPTYFDDAVTTIASIYVQQGMTGITQIEDIRPVIGFKAGGVNASAIHGNLLGLSANDHPQYLLVDGSSLMSGNLVMGGNNIVSAGTINNVTIQSHASRHQNGGSDEVGTSTPSGSAIPKADAYGHLDSWISNASTSVKGLTSLSSSPISATNPIAVGVTDSRFLSSISGTSQSNNTLTLTNNSGVTLTYTPNAVTGGTYYNGTITLSGSGTLSSITGLGSLTPTTLYSGDGTLSGNRIVSQSGNTLTFSGDNSSKFIISEKLEQGLGNIASGLYSHAEGKYNTASGDYSHSEGHSTTASGEYSHAEGKYNTASGRYSHSEGENTFSQGQSSHAEGYYTTSSGKYSHAEGVGYIQGPDFYVTEDSNYFSYSQYSGQINNVSLFQFTVSGDYSSNTVPYTLNSFFLSNDNGETGVNVNTSFYKPLIDITSITYDSNSGYSTFNFSPELLYGYYNVSGTGNHSIGLGSHAEGHSTCSIGIASHSEGANTCSSGNYSHSEGIGTCSSGYYSHSEGFGTTSSGSFSHAEGRCTTSSGYYSHSEGYSTCSIGNGSHAEGFNTTSSGSFSHAEGRCTTSSGNYSHAEGFNTTSSGDFSHAEGYLTTSSGNFSHAGGIGTYSSGYGQTSYGKYNVTGNTTSLFVIGNGTSNSSRSDLVLFDSTGVTINNKLIVSASTNPVQIKNLSNSTNTRFIVSDNSGILTYRTDVLTGSSSVSAVTLSSSNILSVTRNGSSVVNTTINAVTGGTYNNGTITLSGTGNVNGTKITGFSSSSTTLYSGDGTINGNRVVTQTGTTLTFSGDSSSKLRISEKFEQGFGNTASGGFSHAQGYQTTSSGNYSHSEGYSTCSIGNGSHSEGQSTCSIGDFSHTEGNSTTASGNYSHAEGVSTRTGTNKATLFPYLLDGVMIIDGDVESQFTTGDTVIIDDNFNGGTESLGRLKAIIDASNYFGSVTTIYLTYPYTSGFGDTPVNVINISKPVSSWVGTTTLPSPGSHVEGCCSQSIGYYSHAEGRQTYSIGDYSHSQGFCTTSSGNYSHSEGLGTTSSGNYSHSEGQSTCSIGDFSHTEGNSTTASGNYSHAEGFNTTSSGSFSHAEGRCTTSSGYYSHSEGYNTTSSGVYSHSEGSLTTSSGPYSHAEGRSTTSSGDYSHAEGTLTTSSGRYSHAEGFCTCSIGEYSHSEGYCTTASGYGSHAGGVGTYASGSGQTAYGKYNVTGNTTSLFVIGNGTSNSSRSDLALFDSTGVTINTKLIITDDTTPVQINGLINSGNTRFIVSNSSGVLTYRTDVLTGSSSVSAVTLSSANILSVTSNGGSVVNTTINAVTGGTYSNGTITLSGTGNVNGTQITGLSTGGGSTFTGGTVSGPTNFTNGLTANTLNVVGSITASTSIARSTYLTPTLNAAANGDVLVALDINPTFTLGAFTGTTSAALRVAGNIIPFVNTTFTLGAPTLRFQNTYTNALYTTLIRGNTVTFGDEVGNNYARFFLSTTGNLALGSVTDNLSRLQVQNGTGQGDGQLGVELLTTGTGTNWTGSNFTTGYTHTSGSIVALSASTFTPAINSPYQVQYTVSGTVTGTVTITMGGITIANLIGNTTITTIGARATSSALLTITPTTDFTGTVIMSVKLITVGTATQTWSNSAGTITNEVRASSSTTNTFMGLNAGTRNTTGVSNTFIGNSAGQFNLSANNNTFIGSGAGAANTTSGGNTFIGTNAGSVNTTAGNNTFIGSSVATSNTTGSANVAIGATVFGSNTTGTQNIVIGGQQVMGSTTGSSSTNVIGFQALQSLTTGGGNNILGNQAGKFITDGVTSLTTLNNSIFIGNGTKALSDGNTNSIVIGNQTIGLGSNTTVLGTTGTTTTGIYGRTLIGNTTLPTDDGSSVLQVSGTSKLTGQVIISGSVTAISGSTAGLTYNQSLTQRATVGDQIYGFNLTPTFTNAASGQTQTAFRINATFTGTSTGTSTTNLIADMGAVGVGTQFSVNDITSGSIYMVNDVSGLPIIEATSNWDVNIYNYPNIVLKKSGNTININGNQTIVPLTGNTSVALTVSGSNTRGGTGYTDFIQVTNTASGATNINKFFRVNNTGGFEIVSSDYGTTIFTLTNAGVLSTPGGGTSDRRTKNNIEYISDSSVSIINQLKPVKFEYSQYPGITRHGFIAQDVLDVEPKLVLGDGDNEGGTYGLDYDGILSLTVKALQEAINRIEVLEKTVQELKNGNI